MPKEIIKDPILSIDGTDLSDRCSQAVVEFETNEVDQSTFGGDYSEQGKGLKDATITLTFHQDYEVGQVDATLWPLSQQDDPFTVRIKPHDAVVSDTNPEYVMAEAHLYGYSPLSGEKGAASTTDVPFRNAGPDGLERRTAPSS